MSLDQWPFLAFVFFSTIAKSPQKLTYFIKYKIYIRLQQAAKPKQASARRTMGSTRLLTLRRPYGFTPYGQTYKDHIHTLTSSMYPLSLAIYPHITHTHTHTHTHTRLFFYVYIVLCSILPSYITIIVMISASHFASLYYGSFGLALYFGPEQLFGPEGAGALLSTSL